MELTGFEPITPGQREEFQREGILLIRGALTERQRDRLEKAVDRVYSQERAGGRLKPDGSLHLLGFLPRDDAFGDLLTHARTFPYIWGLAGWNIYSHHNHLDVTPPNPSDTPPAWGWHQDGYRQNSDPESLTGAPRPMLSLKVAYVLSDLSRTGRGATKVLPASHLSNTLERPADGGDPRGTVEITANPGDAFVFDRRLWHSRSVNHSTVTRKMLFIGYTYRWIRPLDDMPIDRDSTWWANRSDVQKQLLGDTPHTANNWGVGWDGYIDEKIPLRHELSTRGLLDRSIPWLR
jgi:ectoine hydroxylase-related dioxygenase (phytanoyl-CoA dioxygenase family)